MFALVALLAANFDPTWPSIVWDFTGFCLASIGGTIDGYLVRPTELKPAQTRRELIRRERLLKKITH
ncbi:hypothetical protein [Levilactobacillus spicheri]